MHEKIRLELIIERMALKRACRILETAGVSGYTVLPALSGYGRGSRWQRDRDLSASQDMVVIISISDEAPIRNVLLELHELLDQHIGILNTSRVEVLRPDRF
ncbi:DUF190 domain-containing protein [Hyphomonas sp.]|uniref:DUF190 domain-containing protein n=1 Tax=Hyphomonas sp. TaxID=87 RepID=UPI0035691267